MLPPPLLSVYRQYKEDTDAVASWLAATARAHGYPANLLTNAIPSQQRQGGRLKGKARKTQQKPEKKSAKFKYTVAIKDFVPLAEWIASRQPPVEVPSSFVSVINRVIADDDSNQRHSYFVGVLKKVRDVLKPRMPAGASEPTSRQLDEPENLSNMFSALTVYEPSEEDLESFFVSMASPTPEKPEQDIVYEAEAQTSIVDAMYPYMTMYTDLDRIRHQIRWIWATYQIGMVDLVAAAIATNSAIGLARSLIDDVLPALQPHSVWDVAQTFYFASCLAKGFSFDDILDANGRPSPETYDVQDDVYMVAYNVLTSLLPVLITDLPVYKDGSFGTYDPKRFRPDLSGQEKIQDDLILLTEMFTELVTVGRLVDDFPVQDELMRGIKEMDKTREISFHLVFSAQVFLDIHHVLRYEADHPFQQLMKQLDYMETSLRRQMEFHEGLEFENWPASNERALQGCVSRIQWLSNDPVFKAKQRAAARQNMTVEETLNRHRMLRHSPVLAGLMLFQFRGLVYDIGIAAANLFGSISYTWHLYNATRREKLLPTRWDDMDVLYSTLGSSNFHVGDAPKHANEYLVRYCLQMGVSVAFFANKKQRGRSIKLQVSRAGPRRFKDGAPVSKMFTDRYVWKTAAQFDWTAEHLYQIISCGRWQAEDPTKDIPTFMIAIDDPEANETLEFAFPYLEMHRHCWGLLRRVKKACEPLLLQSYGPNYIPHEGHLPQVVGYAFWLAAAGSVEGHAKVQDMRLLEIAAREIHELLDVTGSNAMIEIMRENMGLWLEIKTEREDGGAEGSERRVITF
ncbi:hypothetical protein N656DRAFT_837525 [Canariomyces notabilis]|uniref:DUF6604 domain-containing protein n=1 Tax=Canariomyces notabilis TaxID=2074819 RepID=A0AAN6YRS6_9PEZI|nr:hypothetical protein N656DRAFT_837525 [Canariomyces arenarius]